MDLFNTVFHNTIYFYSQSINAKPFEVSFQRRGCLDHWNAKTQMLACRKQLDINGRPVWDSQVCIGSLYSWWDLAIPFNCFLIVIT